MPMNFGKRIDFVYADEMQQVCILIGESIRMDLNAFYQHFDTQVCDSKSSTICDQFRTQILNY